MYFKKLLENFEEIQSILRKFTENFGRDFKLEEIFEILL